jgi:hypothetical protein
MDLLLLLLFTGVFCDGTHRNAVPEALPQKDAGSNGVPEPFLPGINITNTYPSPTKFWVTLCVPEHIFVIKISLYIYI